MKKHFLFLFVLFVFCFVFSSCTNSVVENKSTLEKNGIIYNVYKRTVVLSDKLGATQYRITVKQKQN